MLAGFRSLWITHEWCRYLTPMHICFMRTRTVSTGRVVPLWTSLCRSVPAKSKTTYMVLTGAGGGGILGTSTSDITLGWFKRRRMEISRRMRSASVLEMKTFAMRLTARNLPVPLSAALHTHPYAPLPTLDLISYCPGRFHISPFTLYCPGASCVTSSIFSPSKCSKLFTAVCADSTPKWAGGEGDIGLSRAAPHATGRL
mmetsp:Transcript_39255/g.91732  ORF Transcript_39255/g.91732 Transcript_39255/m.91732 type:complete len:200 (+) Transcript_39255:504-1103(+)